MFHSSFEKRLLIQLDHVQDTKNLIYFLLATLGELNLHDNQETCRVSTSVYDKAEKWLSQIIKSKELLIWSMILGAASAHQKLKDTVTRSFVLEDVTFKKRPLSRSKSDHGNHIGLHTIVITSQWKEQHRWSGKNLKLHRHIVIQQLYIILYI